jgi:hypothetical protein
VKKKKGGGEREGRRRGPESKGKTAVWRRERKGRGKGTAKERDENLH